MALVEPHPEAALDVAEIKAFLRQRLSGFKLPRHVEIRTDLPRQDSGKILKRLLRAPYWQQAGRQI